MIDRCIVLLTIGLTALAQESGVVPSIRPETTIPRGVPLRVALEYRVAIKRVGEPIYGRLVEPVYVFDRMVLPAGSVVEGHIAEIGGVPATRRFTAALLNGNLTPPRKVRAQFDALVLRDGTRLPLRTSAAAGTAHTMRVAKPRKKGEPKSAIGGIRDRIAERMDPALLAFKEPGRMNRLKSRLFEMLPYHRQAWAAGTLFNGVLQQPLIAPAQEQIEARNDYPASAEPDAGEVSARLLTPISSATARRGAPVEAVVTRPLFSADHRLLIPEGSRLLGDVVQAQRARYFHRSGKVLFVFREVKLAPATVQSIKGYLEGVEVDFNTHLVLDSEGAAHISSSKARLIFPAIAASVAGLSFHQDYNAQGVPDADSAGRAESGAVGLGLIGTLVAQLGPRVLASSIAIGGAAYSIYSTLIARGANVVLPENTPVTVSLKSRGGEVSAGQP